MGEAIKTTDIPKHLQLRNIVIKMIKEDFASGDRFLSERELMKRFKVSSITVSRAMKSLVADGVIERRVGGGTFIKNSEGVSLLTPLTEVPVLLFNGACNDRIINRDPLNWFIISEIQRGIINTYPGNTQILTQEEMLSLMEENDSLSAIFLNPSMKYVEKIRSMRNRYVIIDQSLQLQPAFDCIQWDCMAGVFRLMSYFIHDSGHQRIALLTADNPTHKSRIAGYKIGLETYGLGGCDDYFKVCKNGTKEAGYQAMKELLLLGNNRPTAVFVDTDIKAEGAIQAAVDAGLNVPDNISIAGFDDIPDAAYFEPPLTTVKVPYFDMGREAVKKLQQPVTEKQECKILQTKLILRSTAGQAPQVIKTAKFK